MMNECVETVQLKSEVQVEDDSDTQRAIMVVTGTTAATKERTERDPPVKVFVAHASLPASAVLSKSCQRLRRFLVFLLLKYLN